MSTPFTFTATFTVQLFRYENFLTKCSFTLFSSGISDAPPPSLSKHLAIVHQRCFWGKNVFLKIITTKHKYLPVCTRIPHPRLSLPLPFHSSWSSPMNPRSCFKTLRLGDDGFLRVQAKGFLAASEFRWTFFFVSVLVNYFVFSINSISSPWGDVHCR